jgi:hypothetical protein
MNAHGTSPPLLQGGNGHLSLLQPLQALCSKACAT